MTSDTEWPVDPQQHREWAVKHLNFEDMSRAHIEVLADAVEVLQDGLRGLRREMLLSGECDPGSLFDVRIRELLGEDADV